MVRRPVRNQELIDQTVTKVRIALEREHPTVDRCIAVLDYHFACLDADDETPLELAGIQQDICSHLYEWGVASVEQLCEMTEQELRSMEFIGPARAMQVIEALARHKLELKKN